MMIKGHATIELTNVHTGEKEIIEHHNLITDVVNDHMNELAAVMTAANFKSNFTPLYNAAMGGILLFKDQLEVSADNIAFPFNKSLTGYASNDANNTTDTKRGSRNLTESVALSNGFKYVWDFGTNQANGDISALALTGKEAGADPYCAPFLVNDIYVTGNQEHLIDYDFENDIFYTYRATGLGSSLKLYICKYRYVKNNLSITDEINTIQLLSENEVTKIDSTLKGCLHNWVRISKQYQSYYYGICDKSITGGNDKYLFRINADTLEYDISFGIKKLLDMPVNFKNSPIVIYNDCLYWIVSTSSGYSIARISLINFSADLIAIPGSTSMNFLSLYSPGVLLLQDYAYLIGSNTFVETNIKSLGAEQVYSDKGYMVYIKQQSGTRLNFGESKNYLASINNLDGSVTKTADKTMKIIYTITESWR